MSEIKIREATKADAKDLLDIYEYYVKNTAITFEYDVPTVEEFEARIEHTMKKYPYIVAIFEDKIAGYAYASPFKERAAYDYAVETSIYVKNGITNKGIGRVLYENLESTLKLQNVVNVNACIGYPEVEDEYLTKNSVEFHEHMGYTMVGEFHKCGYKFGRWYNMVWMEKMIGEHKDEPGGLIAFPKVRGEFF